MYIKFRSGFDTVTALPVAELVGVRDEVSTVSTGPRPKALESLQGQAALGAGYGKGPSQPLPKSSAGATELVLPTARSGGS